MYDRSFTFCYYMFLLIVLFLIFRPSSTSDNKKDHNSTARYKLDKNIKKNSDKQAELVQYILHKNSTKHNVQYEFCTNSTRNKNNSMQHEFSTHFSEYSEKDNQMPMKLQTNFTNKNNFSNKNDNKNIVSYEMCGNITCIQLCCPLGNRLLIDKGCIAGTNEYVFPEVYNSSNNLKNESKKVNEFFQLTVRDPCQGTDHIPLNLNDFPVDFLNGLKYMFLANGSLYFSYVDIFIESSSYCLAIVDDSRFDAIICLETMNKIEQIINVVEKIFNKLIIIFLSCRIVCMLCVLTMFLIYSILPELRNIHSFMLRRYSSTLFIGYILDIMDFPISNVIHQIYPLCVTSALINYFCTLASSFWLSVISFDMWWTFRNLHSLQKNVKQQKRKKLIYAIFAWGGPFILTIICVLMDFVFIVPKNLIRPKFGVYSCWFDEIAAFQLYFYGPQSICIIITTCLSIYTALKIARYEKDTARYLKDSESRCYNDNKQWFNLYLKFFIMLFILIAINWIITTVWEFWPLNYTNYIKIQYIFCIIFLMDTVQNIGIFIIFVCKKTIMQLLLKRLCQIRRSIFKTSTHRHCYRLEQLHVKNNFSVEKYQVRESELSYKEFI